MIEYAGYIFVILAVLLLLAAVSAAIVSGLANIVAISLLCAAFACSQIALLISLFNKRGKK